MLYVGLGGLEVTCSPRDPRFEGLTPTEADGFFFFQEREWRLKMGQQGGAEKKINLP